MAEVSALVEGGKATAGAPLGPALGPLGVNIGQIVAQINEKTKAYAGIKVPVTIEIAKDKSFQIVVGSPPMSALIIKELKIAKGGAHQLNDTVGNMTMDQVKKVAEMKLEGLTSTDLYHASREVIGTCNSMGVTIEGKRAGEMQKEFAAGTWNSFFGLEEKPKDDLQKFSKDIKTEAKAIGKELAEVVHKVEEKISKAIHPETKKEKPVEAKPVEAKPVRKMAEKPVEKPVAVEAKAKAEAKQVQAPQAPKAMPVKEASKAESSIPKKSYSQHMAEVEKQSGVKKKSADEKPKKVETETFKTSSTEISRPKKKK